MVESSAVASSSVAPSSSDVASSTESLTAPTTLTNTLTSTDANGVLYTITQTIRNGNTGQSSAAAGGSASFLENTGAVAGTFVAVGLVVTVGVMAFVAFMLKRRRRQRLDRDVAAAAAAAAAASHHKGYDDEDDNGPAMTQYGGYYSSNGMEVLDHPQPRMDYDYEDPAGGYDHYAADLTPGDRTSTATAAGMAGFGAHSAQQTYHPDDQQAYATNDQQAYPSHDEQAYPSNDQQYYAPNDGAFNAVTSDDPNTAAQPSSAKAQHRPSNGYYFDPNQAYDFATTTDDAYGGSEEALPPMPVHHRSGSAGSVSRTGDANDRGLKITNY